jgi:hypothetical protein
MEVFGTIESVKAVSGSCPVSGEVPEVNGTVVDKPEAGEPDPTESGSGGAIANEGNSPPHDRRGVSEVPRSGRAG